MPPRGLQGVEWDCRESFRAGRRNRCSPKTQRTPRGSTVGLGAARQRFAAKSTSRARNRTPEHLTREAHADPCPWGPHRRHTVLGNLWFPGASLPGLTSVSSCLCGGARDRHVTSGRCCCSASTVFGNCGWGGVHSSADERSGPCLGARGRRRWRCSRRRLCARHAGCCRRSSAAAVVTVSSRAYSASSKGLEPCFDFAARGAVGPAVVAARPGGSIRRSSGRPRPAGRRLGAARDPTPDRARFHLGHLDSRNSRGQPCLQPVATRFRFGLPAIPGRGLGVADCWRWRPTALRSSPSPWRAAPGLQPRDPRRAPAARGATGSSCVSVMRESRAASIRRRMTGGPWAAFEELELQPAASRGAGGSPHRGPRRAQAAAGTGLVFTVVRGGRDRFSDPGAGRPLVERRPDPLRIEHHQRIHRRPSFFRIPQLMAGRSGDARAGTALSVPFRARDVQPTWETLEKGKPANADKARAAIPRQPGADRAGIRQAEIHAGRRVSRCWMSRSCRCCGGLITTTFSCRSRRGTPDGNTPSAVQPARVSSTR